VMKVTGARTTVAQLNGSNRTAVEFTIAPRSAEQLDAFFSEIILEANALGLKGIRVTEIQAEQMHGIPRETVIRLVVGDGRV
jgi:hypothetical protein